MTKKKTFGASIQYFDVLPSKEDEKVHTVDAAKFGELR